MLLFFLKNQKIVSVKENHENMIVDIQGEKGDRRRV